MKNTFLLAIIALLSSYGLKAQWVAQPSDLSPNRFAQFIDAVDSNVVWALAADPANQSTPVQEFTKTVDGGALWISNPISNAAGLSPSGICAINADTAWVAMYNGTAGGGRILRTNDGGISWTWQSTAQFAAPAGFPNWVHFFDADNGVCMGDPTGGYFEIYTTTDGGANWIRVPQGNIPANQAGEFGVTSVFTAYGDSSVWFGTNQGRIFRSSDRGLNWLESSTPYAGSFIGDIAFRNKFDGIASNGSPGAPTDIIRTNDGGVTWNLVTTNTVNIPNKVLSSVPGADSTFFLSSPQVGGGTAFTLNDGTSWSYVDNLIHSDIDFVNPTTGWTGSNQLNAPMYKWTGEIVPVCLNITGPLEFASPDSICTVDSIVYSVHIDRTADIGMRTGFNAVFYDENYNQVGAQTVFDLVSAGFPNQFVPDPGQTDIGTLYFTIFFTLAPTSEIIHFGVQVFPTQCIDDTSNMIINSVFQNIVTCAQTTNPIPGALALDLSACPQTGLVTYNTSYSYNGFPPLPGSVFNCNTLSGQVIVTFYVDNGVCVKTVTDTIFCTTSIDELASNTITLHPNPVVDQLTITSGSGLKIETAEVLDMYGRLVLSARASGDAAHEFRLDLSSLSGGSYLLRVWTKEGYFYTRKFIRN